MKKFYITLFSVILISCAAVEPETVVEESKPLEKPTAIDTSTTTSSTTTVIDEEPFTFDEFGLEIIETPIGIQEQILELMKFVEKWVGLEFKEVPSYILHSQRLSGI